MVAKASLRHLLLQRQGENKLLHQPRALGGWELMLYQHQVQTIVLTSWLQVSCHFCDIHIKSKNFLNNHCNFWSVEGINLDKILTYSTQKNIPKKMKVILSFDFFCKVTLETERMNSRPYFIVFCSSNILDTACTLNCHCVQAVHLPQ